MIVSLYLRKIIMLVNKGELEKYKIGKNDLLDFLKKGKDFCVNDDSEESNEEKKDSKLKIISLEKIEEIYKKIEIDLSKIDQRLENLEKKREADKLLQENSDLPKAKEIYTLILKHDPKNIKGNLSLCLIFSSK